MGAVWAYDLIFLFFGPEMTQNERNEEAAAALEYERLRKEGMSLVEIGMARARGDFKTDGANGEKDVKSKDVEVEHIEN